MSTSFLQQVRLGIVCVCCLFMLLLLSACSNIVGGTGVNSGTVVGSIQSVSTANHSITVNVNGQIVTISNLTDQQITALQSQVGKRYSFSVQETQGSANSYTMSDNTDPTETDNATPVVNITSTPETSDGTTTTNVTGGISFIGKVQQTNGSIIVIAMPNGQTLSMTVVNGQSDLAHVGGSIPAINTVVKVEANAMTDGSFTLSKLEATDAGDLQDATKINTVDMHGTTTQAVGSDNIVHMKVGSKIFAFVLNSSSELKDFANAQAITNNQPVKVEVLFNGSNGSILKIENNND